MLKTDNLAKEKDIKKEKERLSSIYKDLEENKKKIIVGLVDEASFMRATLKQLKTIINEEGILDEMQQGSYTIVREHPAVKIYNNLVRRYNSTIKQLIRLIPEQKPEEDRDIFMDFVNSRPE